MGEPESGPPERPTPKRDTTGSAAERRPAFAGLALCWVVAVSALYLAVRVFGVTIVR